MKILKHLQKLAIEEKQDQPVLIEVADIDALEELKLFCENTNTKFLKPIEHQLKEFEEVFALNPKFRSLGMDFKTYIEKYLGSNSDIMGKFFYFGWDGGMIAQILPENLHYELITWRNKNKLLDKEQQVLKNSKVGIIGSSVGSFATKTVSKLGVGHLRVAEPKAIKPSNTPRIYVDSLRFYGEHKLIPLSHNIFEFNPYIKIDMFLSGFDDSNSDSFFGKGEDQLDIVIDAADDANTKILIRKLCKEYKIPLVTGFDEKGCMIVERFDQEGYHSVSPQFTKEELETLKATDQKTYAMKLLEYFPGGHDNLTARQKSTIDEIFNRSLGGFSQLSWEAALFGGYIAKAVSDILLGSKLCGVFMLDLDKEFNTDKNFEKLKSA